MTTTPKPQTGTWILTAPNGKQWQADSPLKATAAEQRERVPAEIAVARIFAACDEADESAAQPEQPAKAPDWLTTITQLYKKITPLPWFEAADGRGVGLCGNRWTRNGGFSDVTKESVSRHGGTHFDNLSFIVALVNAWPRIQSAITQPEQPTPKETK